MLGLYINIEVLGKTNYQFFKDGVRVEMMKPEQKERVREYMLKTFYNSAPIPSALGLANTVHRFPYLKDELGKIKMTSQTWIQLSQCRF